MAKKKGREKEVSKAKLVKFCKDCSKRDKGGWCRAWEMYIPRKAACRLWVPDMY